MKKVWNQLGAGPWDYEIDALRVEQRMDLYKAKCLVIMKWMQAGDLRPMLAAIKKDGVLRGPVLGLLVQMIESGQLAFKKGGRGRRPDPEAAVRDHLAADIYEDFLKDHQVSSDDLFRAIGSVAGVSVESVRQAVTTKRRRPKPK
jgi:hypothetical protein